MLDKKVINISAKKTKNLKDKIVGLIGKKPYALLIKTRFGIHTFGLKFPIDVLILDKKNKVVSLKKNLMSGRIFLWNPIYDKVLELPQGTIDKKKIEINDTVNLIINMLY